MLPDTSKAQDFIITDGLVSCWDMEELSGTRLDSWAGYDLTDNNTVGRAAGYVSDYAAHFVNANLEYFTHDDVSGHRFEEISIYAIYYLDNLATHQTLVGKYGVDAGTRQFMLSVLNTGFVSWYASWDGTSTPNVIQLSTTASAWHIVMAGQDSSTGPWLRQGEAETSTARTGVLYDVDEPLRFGLWGAVSWPLDAKIDITALWDRPLSIPEQDWLYNAGNGRSCSDIIGGGVLAYDVQLPSGRIGTVDMTITAGDVGIISGLLFLSILALFYLARRTVLQTRASNK
jgi:hypothetical protein